MDIDLDDPQSGPAELRAALKAERQKAIKLEGKLSEQAFIDAGFGDKESRERKALEKFFDGDRTDPEAIKTFAKEELGFTGEITGEPAPTHTDPAPTVVADARGEQLDATATADDDLDPNPDEVVARHIYAAVEASRTQGSNEGQVLQAISAELQRFGYKPDEPIGS